MVEPDFTRFDTRALHAGQQPDPTTGSRAVPIHQTTSYVFDSVDHAAGLFNLEVSGHLYSRISNPTVAVLEERIAALEGGVGAVCTASGQAALHLAVATLLDAGHHVVASRNIYGGSHNLLNLTMPRFGITTTFVDPRDPQAFADAIRPETRMVFAETLGNPGLEVLDVAAVAAVAHDHGLPLAVDSTFATPYLLRPIEYGADIVIHSVTKFLGGHGVAIGGVVVDGGRFDWDASGLFPTLSEPYDGYHGITFTEEFGPQALSMRARAEGLRDFGACMSPANAFYLLQGVETLPLRMARHVENTLRVVEMLDGHEAVEWIKHPSHPSHPDHELAARQMDRYGGMVSLELEGGEGAAQKFLDGLELFTQAVSLGDVESLATHPASTTHELLPPEVLERQGITPGLVRLSIGIEDPRDLIEDIERALAALAE